MLDTTNRVNPMKGNTSIEIIYIGGGYENLTALNPNDEFHKPEQK